MKNRNIHLVSQPQINLSAVFRRECPKVETFTDRTEQRLEQVIVHSQKCGGGRRIIRKKIGGD